MVSLSFSLRTGSKTFAAATVILDMGKAALPILVIEQLAQAGLPTEPWWPPMVALAACLGHCFPPWLRFRGGKAVASFLGAWLALSLIGGLALCLTWLVVALVWRWSSLAALSATFAAPILAWGDPVALGFAIALSALVWIRHAGNLRRLLADEEPKIGQK